ncbi:MAG: NADH-quinone oxidoreductase subunit D [Actinobacteria bacterium]|nr:NADH-quinone oxidoreductase subunit D [Actinomycetota bacterium]
MQLAAALVGAGDHVTPRIVQNAIAVLAPAAATGFSFWIMLETQHGLLIHWYGGWHPIGNLAIGIGFVGDSLGAGMAVLSCTLVTLALVYSLTYMRESSRLFDVLMLVFCGAMAGFSLTGDLFNMFVWFELMGVAAYALAGFKVEELGPLQGAVNFAITNTAGAYLILMGIGLLYARTGALNFAQIGHFLATHPSDRLVVVAFTLVLIGFLVKAAIVPFHWWLADAHAAAPAPVCVLFSGAMVELGLFAIARIYWTVFSGGLHAHQGDVRSLLVWIGVVTALVGAVMCFLQRHLKRLLAFSTIAHSGTMLVGIGLLGAKGLAGTANLILSHGFLKAGLFLAAGIVLLRLRDIDELRLHGAGRNLRWERALWFAAAIGLIGFPYVGVFVGHSLVDEEASGQGFAWVPPLLLVAEAVSAGAILRAGARVFLGWGPKRDPLLSWEPEESPPERSASVPLLLAVTTVTVAIGLVMSVIPGLQVRTENGAERFVDRSAYAARVLHAKSTPAPPHLPFAIEVAKPESWAYGIGAAVLAFAFAAAGLWYRRLPELVLGGIVRGLGPPVRALRAAHSGIIGDYLLWLTIGATVVGGAWAFSLR